jgi:uncharacterized integral membrane protein
MPWRLIVFILIFIVLLAFITLNLENKCDISFGFAKIAQAPVFLTVFMSFILGFLSTLPFIITAGRKRARAEKGERPAFAWGKKARAGEKAEAAGEGASPPPEAAPSDGGSSDAE